MAAFTGRYIFVLFFMTEDTGQFCVFRINAAQCVADALMTGSAVLVGHLSSVCYHEGHMRRMAHCAVFINHVR